MRIVQVGPWFHPHIGGVESHIKTISAELVRRGHDVTVVTSRFDRRLPEREEMEGYRILRTRTRGVWFRTPITRSPTSSTTPNADGFSTSATAMTVVPTF